VSDPASDSGTDVAGRLLRLVRDVPDYPKPGIVFKDITPLLADHDTFALAVRELARHAGSGRVDKVVGIEARGFILAAPVALALQAGFVPVRKQGKLPWQTHAMSYSLEYGEATLEVHRDAFSRGDRVLIVDDVLATGGTVAATADLVRHGGGRVVGVSVLIELGFLAARERLGELDPRALLTV
jgi:adenine phosphoribosyltransferase